MPWLRSEVEFQGKVSHQEQKLARGKGEGRREREREMLEWVLQLSHVHVKDMIQKAFEL
jgi:hypothetical protein